MQFKYYIDDEETSRETAFKILKDFVREHFKTDYSENEIETMFSRNKYNSYQVKDKESGEYHIISSKEINYVREIPSTNRQLSLF